jgi:hypothetical protein
MSERLGKLGMKNLVNLFRKRSRGRRETRHQTTSEQAVDPPPESQCSTEPDFQLEIPDPQLGGARWTEKISARFLDGSTKEIFWKYIWKPTKLMFPLKSPGSIEPIYQYKPLASGWIRLIRCRPSPEASSESMGFEVVESPLEKAKDRFVAMSYYWGTSPPDRFMPLTDGSHLLVTEVVQDMLTSIFRRDDEYIWVDALCINQANNKEKAVQIGMMKDIYKSARRVSVWLGQPEDEAMEHEILSNFGGALTGERKHIEAGFRWFGGLMSRPWWHRIWIIQEVTVCEAKMCGFTSAQS